MPGCVAPSACVDYGCRKQEPLSESIELLQRVVNWVPVVLSLSVHEWAHARSAWALGDDTAAQQGRLTLNPLAHMDMWGTVILPLLGVPFGWAKPVPVNPRRFTRGVTMRTGMMLTAAAGPLSNVALAIIAALVMTALRYAAPQLLSPAVLQLLGYGVIINLSLAAFNMLPLFPLDGSRVVDGLLPYRLRGPWEQFQKVSPFILLFVIIGLPYLNISLFGWVGTIARWLFSVALG